MKKWGKLLFSLLVAEAMLLPKSAVAFATDNTVDLSRTGSLSITLRESDGSHAAMQGGTFCIYEVAQAEIENANFAYIPTEDFEESGADLSDLNAPGLAEHLAAYAAAEHLSGLVDTTGADGRVTFSDLQLGLYLVMQKGTVPGYYQVSPFLVTVPLMNGEGTDWIYDVEAGPKIQIIPEPSEDSKIRVEKVWKDDGTHPQSIQVQLLKDGAAYDTVMLHEGNGWAYAWADLDAGSRWTVVEREVLDGYFASYETIGTKTTITNTKPGTTPPDDVPPLIQTGQLNWPIPVLVISGVILLAVGFYMRRRHEA